MFNTLLNDSVLRIIRIILINRIKQLSNNDLNYLVEENFKAGRFPIFLTLSVAKYRR